VLGASAAVGIGVAVITGVGPTVGATVEAGACEPDIHPAAPIDNSITDMANTVIFITIIAHLSYSLFV